MIIQSLIYNGKQHKSVLAKFRCGVASIKLELGRHKGISVNERTCPFCTDNCIENEVHALTNSSLYVDYSCESYKGISIILGHNLCV